MTKQSRTSQSTSLSSLLHSVSAWAVTGAVVLVPLLISPWTVGPLEQIKALALSGLSVIALLCWVAGMIIDRRFSLRGGLFANLVPLLMPVAFLLSSLFSVGKGLSWFGQESQEYTSLAVIASLTALYYVIINLENDRLTRRLIIGLIASFTIIAICAVLAVFGINVIGFNFTKYAGFNLVGTYQSMTIALTAISTLGLGLIMPEKSRLQSGVGTKVAVALVTLLTVISLLFVDFNAGWISALIAMVVLSGFFFLNSSRFKSMKVLIVPAIIFVLSVVFLFVRVPVQTNIPVLVSPSGATSWSVAQQVLKQSALRAVVGTGPGTYIVDFARFKPTDVAKTDFFAVRFDRASSHLLTVLTTVGLLGAIAWLLFVANVALVAVKSLASSSESTENWGAQYALFASWTVLLIAQVLDSSSVVISLLFITLSALLVREGVVRRMEYSVNSSPKVMASVAGVSGIVAVAMIAMVFGLLTRFGANVAFANAIKAQNSGAKTDEIEAKLLKAVQKNDTNAEYLRNLASIRLSRAVEMINSKTEKMTDDELATLKSLITGTLEAADGAVVASPNDSVNWSIRSAIYRELLPLVSGADQVARQSGDQSVGLEPVNVANIVDRARVELAIGDQATAILNDKASDQATKDNAQKVIDETLKNAEMILGKAVELKSDYAPAYYYLAAVFERSGKVDEAAKRLELAYKYAPTDLGLGLQLGLVYLKQEKLDEAQKTFENLVKLYPDYSNAMWYLAAIYANNGKKQEALDLLAKVAKLNPENEAVKQAIDQLNGNATPSAVPEPVEQGNEGLITPSVETSTP